MSEFAKAYLSQIKQDFEKVKSTGERAFRQVDEGGLNFKASPESNSIAMLVRHLSGNMRSRFTDFLTADGEKPFRHRDLEFSDGAFGRQELEFAWEEGWNTLLKAISDLKPEDVLIKVTIRNEPHTVLQALQRQLAHYSYHVGQIVMLAKILQGQEWETLSIPKGKSEAFNQEMTKKGS